MSKKITNILKILIYLFVLYLFVIPSYTLLLPTIPIYDNKEVEEVKEHVKSITIKDIELFKLTDQSVVKLYKNYVPETEEELYKLESRVNIVVTILKYLINRPRPYQLEEINNLDSNTDKSPSMPAGHAFQAYYLAHILSKKYPNKKKIFDTLAMKCDDVRVSAGIHYPSDGILSKQIIDFLIKFKII